MSIQVLSGAQMEELAEALASAYDADSLERMVQFKLGKELGRLVPLGDSGMNTVSFKLIRLAEQEGWTNALIQAVYITRAGNAKVAQFVETHWPQAKTPEEAEGQVQKVTQGLQALTGIVQRLADPAIRLIIGRFRADFDITREKIGSLARYKALHDQLHQLSATYLRSMTSAAALWQKDEAQFQLLESLGLRLKGDAGRARQVAQGLRSYRAEQDWIDSLEEASALVQQATDANDEAVLRQGIETLRRVLREEPVRINALLCDTAGDLRLEQLIQAMREVRDHLNRVPSSSGEALPIGQYQSGLDGLLLVQPRLAGLVEEHFEWQWLDKEFMAADALPGVTPQQRFPRWLAFRARLLKLCDLSTEKAWAKDLAALIAALETAGASGDAVQFARRYNKFRTVAADRFFNVDAELSDLSGQLTQVAQPLDQLLRITTDA